MKKRIIILFLILISCSSNEKNSLKEQYQFLKPKFKSELKLNFSKNGIELIEDFESQIQKDLCQSGPYFNGFVIINNEKLTFPLVVYKFCGALAHFRNRIPILINSNSEVLIDYEHHIKSSENIEVKIIESTKDLIKRESKQTIVYLIKWDKKTDSLMFDKRFIELFSAMKSVLNDLSIEKYNKEIDKLSEKELTVLKEIYNPMIGIEQENIIEN